MAAPRGNKFALGLTTTGQEPKYPNTQKGLEEVKAKIIDYFDSIAGEWDEEKNEWKIKPQNATVTGMAAFLGFSSRQSIYDYSKKKVFSYILKRATLIIENGYEESLRGSNPTGSIFALKNMGWKDKAEEEDLKDGANAVENLLKIGGVLMSAAQNKNQHGE